MPDESRGVRIDVTVRLDKASWNRSHECKNARGPFAVHVRGAVPDQSASGALNAAFQSGALNAVPLAVLAMMAVVAAHWVAAGRAIRNVNFFHGTLSDDRGLSLDGAMDSPYAKHAR